MSKLLGKPGLLSNSSVSSLDQVLVSSLERFYDPVKNPRNLAAFKAVLDGKSQVSLRSLEYLVTNYAKKTGLAYTHHGKPFNVFQEYRAQLDSFSKNFFDPFRRGSKITFHGIETAVCQLNYFRWVLRSGLLEYCTAHSHDIRADMLDATRKRKTAEGEPKRRRELSKSKSKECHVATASFTHSFG
jgi:hypothetical protein